jgi:arabinosyltransferase B
MPSTSEANRVVRDGDADAHHHLLPRAHVMATTYLSRDWGSLRKLDTINNATQARIDLGAAVRSVVWNPGHIRIGA